MFVIKTNVGPSAIHGNGVFSGEDVPAGSVVWRFHPPFDHVVSDEQVAELPQVARDYIEMYAYRCLDLGGKLVLSGDHARFLNHSDNPNTEEAPFVSIARQPIASGDEITCDYGAFCADWTTAQSMELRSPSPVQATTANDPVPDRNLYTRLKVSAHGIGVFAIRDIPKGFRLFEGDDVAAVTVSRAVVAAIADAEVRRMYYDFCPVRDGNFIAPAQFNQMTMSWYMNHSIDANVVADENLQFSTCQVVAMGEELTTDYTGFSDDAAVAIAQWKAGVQKL